MTANNGGDGNGGSGKETVIHAGLTSSGFFRFRSEMRIPSISSLKKQVPDITQPVDKTIEQLARWIEKHCVERGLNGELWTAVRQADWLMQEITEVSPWEEWKGAAGLKKVYDAGRQQEVHLIARCGRAGEA